MEYWKKNKHRQSGLTLVELLVSIALSATLMAGVSQVFVGMRQADRHQEELSRMQEAGRFALNFLSQDIRMAGYMGCSSTLNLNAGAADNALTNHLSASTPASFQPELGIQGWEAANTAPGAVNNSVVNNTMTAVTGSGGTNWNTVASNVLDSTTVVDGSDIVKVWSASGAGTSEVVEGLITSLPTGSSPTIQVASTMNVSAGDILLLSDCDQAAWVQACEVGAGGALELNATCTPGNVSTMNTYGVLVTPTSTAIKLSSTTFYIGKRGNTASNPPALFRHTLRANGTAGNAEELVEGIENMQILYGENSDQDTANVADYFVPAHLISNWQNVVSVRISLLVQSLGDNMATAPLPYIYQGVNYDSGTGGSMPHGTLPADRKLRRVFTSTISLRNRALSN